MAQPSEKTSSAVVHHHASCGAAASEGELCPEAALHREGKWTVLVVAVPTQAETPEPPRLSECDLNCLALLTQSSGPLSGAKVRRLLERRGLGIHALITVKRSLLKLKQLGLVLNSRKSPRGYYLHAAGERLLQYRPG